jgi:hypothetical protein
MTCRGSRRNTVDKAKNIYEDSPEWLAQNQRSTKNFIRKWGHFVKHDIFMKPIIPPKYDIGFIVKNGSMQLLEALEPWCSIVYINDANGNQYTQYVKKEQPNTTIDLSEKIKPYDNEKNNEILVTIEGNIFNQQDFEYIQQLSEILANSGEIGSFELGNLYIDVIQINTYEKDLIIC